MNIYVSSKYVLILSTYNVCTEYSNMEVLYGSTSYNVLSIVLYALI